MLTPEEQQVAICLLKSNLGEIGNKVIQQREAYPELDAQNEQQIRQTTVSLKICRSLQSDIEKLKQENARLEAKRMQAKRQSEESFKAIENAQSNGNKFMTQLTMEENGEEEIIRKYEDTLREMSNRLRKARVFYNENEMREEINKIRLVNSGLENKLEKIQGMVNELRLNLEQIDRDVPENILDVFGRTALNNNLAEINNRSKQLQENRSRDTKMVFY